MKKLQNVQILNKFVFECQIRRLVLGQYIIFTMCTVYKRKGQFFTQLYNN